MQISLSQSSGPSYSRVQNCHLLLEDYKRKLHKEAGGESVFRGHAQLVSIDSSVVFTQYFRDFSKFLWAFCFKFVMLIFNSEVFNLSQTVPLEKFIVVLVLFTLSEKGERFLNCVH